MQLTFFRLHSYLKITENLNVGNTISNGSYTIFTKDNGDGFSKYGNILINRFKSTADYKQGIFFYIKNVKNKKVWVNTPTSEDISNECKITFAPERCEFLKNNESIKTKHIKTNKTIIFNNFLIYSLPLLNLRNEILY